METPRQSHLFDLALAGAVTVLVPVIAFVVWPLIVRQMASPPLGAVLTYELDPSALSQGAAPDLDQLTDAVDRRINSGAEKIANVRRLDDRRIEVALIRPDDAETQRVKQLLANTATLEFRILANDQHDKAVIKRALADPSKTQIFDDEGNLLAWWVPVKAGAEKIIADYSDVVRRTTKHGKEEIAEVLVAKDDQDLTGAYLKGAEADIDYRGRPRLILTFSTRGGQLLRTLTNTHLPDKAANFNFKLGVIFNGQLYFAPLIVSAIYERAEITSSFSKQELNEVVGLLNAGSLPARIRPIAKQEAAATPNPSRE